MGDLQQHPICDECGRRHSVISDCLWLMTAAKDDPRDEAYEPPQPKKKERPSYNSTTERMKRNRKEDLF